MLTTEQHGGAQQCSTHKGKHIQKYLTCILSLCNTHILCLSRISPSLSPSLLVSQGLFFCRVIPLMDPSASDMATLITPRSINCVSMNDVSTCNLEGTTECHTTDNYCSTQNVCVSVCLASSLTLIFPIFLNKSFWYNNLKISSKMMTTGLLYVCVLCVCVCVCLSGIPKKTFYKSQYTFVRRS